MVEVGAVKFTEDEEIQTNGSTPTINAHIHTIQLCPNDQERLDEIRDTLSVDKLNLSTEDKTGLICEYADIFALNHSKLECTSVITHHINTGDSPPLRQPARRIPFALRAKVEEMVEEMAEQGVAQ